jgi:ATP-binding cassette, subfamily B, bacterial
MLASLLIPGSDPLRFLPWLLAAAITGIMCNRIGFMALLKMQAQGSRQLQERAFTTLLKRSVGFHNNNVGGKLVSDVIDFPNAYQRFSTALLINLVPFAITVLVGTVIVFTYSLVLGLVIAATVFVTVGSGAIDRYRRTNMREKQIVATKAVTAHLADTIMNVQTVKTFAHEDEEHERHNRLGGKLKTARLNNWISAGVQGNHRITALLAIQIIMVVVIIKLTQQDPHMLAGGIFAFTFTVMLSTRLFEVNSLLKTIDDAFMDAAPMTEILLQEAEIKDRPGANKLAVKKGAIVMDDVGFRYHDSSSDQDVFAGLSLTIKPGEKVGLVGPSGGGKSTLTRLLLRFEDIDGGQILVDGQNIADITQASLREAISYVPQEPLLFHRTILENIAYGKPDASAAAVERAARSAHAHEFIKELPDGYDTIVGERGVKLSGGQRQRIAIARAILKDAPILILDEATSALDSESEVLIQKALRELMEGRTTLVIAHRLSTIQKMDRIIVLEKGTVAEEGTHETLRKRKGLYARLWAHQSGGFLEE